MQLYNSLRRLQWRFKYKGDQLEHLLRTQTLVPSNYYYGHEYWLRKYSGYNNSIKALIEHGLYFGEFEGTCGFRSEWEIGNIITYSEYRSSLLERLYPEYNIFKIGPRILYAETDVNYYNELKNRIDPKKKTMTVFPSHSLAGERVEYDVDSLLHTVNSIACDLGVSNILISLHPSDFIHHVDRIFEDKGYVVVTSGNDNLKFLPRQRAIFEISDITYSNSLGTHIGHSISMNTPHILNTSTMQTRAEADLLTKKFYEEEAQFAAAFNGERPFEITREQKEIVDYYFGLCHFMTPTEMNMILSKCSGK